MQLSFVGKGERVNERSIERALAIIEKERWREGKKGLIPRTKNGRTNFI